MTPLQALKKRCLDCKPYKSEFKKDFCNDCLLKNSKFSNLKKIKNYCFEFCMNKSRNEVELCPDFKCSLYQFRLGKNPNRKGIGNIKADIQKNIKQLKASPLLSKKVP